MDKLLEDACLKLSVVASDIFGVSGTASTRAASGPAGTGDGRRLRDLTRYWADLVEEARAAGAGCRRIIVSLAERIG